MSVDPSAAAPGRVSWLCAVCQQITTDPRHSGVNDDGTSFDRHMDCCSSLGCAVCQNVVDKSGGLKGTALADFIISGGLN